MKYLAAEEELVPWATAQGTVLDRITLSGTLATYLTKPASISNKSSSEEVFAFSHASQAEAWPSALPPSSANAQGHVSRYNES
ncbi:MAG: hypothetical protein ACP5O0_06265 [Acidimicrobiales bacterium]